MDVDPVAVNGVWWRHVRGGGDVHYQPEEPADGRWQHGSTIEALYLGQNQETVWAEWYRYVAETGLPPDIALPRDLWKWRIELTEIADLSTRERLGRIGLAPPLPSRSNWPAYQAAGDKLFELGWLGLLAPSAARPDDLVLCLFRTEREVPGTEPLPPPERIERPPPVPRKMTT